MLFIPNNNNDTRGKPEKTNRLTRLVGYEQRSEKSIQKSGASRFP